MPLFLRGRVGTAAGVAGLTAMLLMSGCGEVGQQPVTAQPTTPSVIGTPGPGPAPATAVAITVATTAAISTTATGIRPAPRPPAPPRSSRLPVPKPPAGTHTRPKPPAPPRTTSPPARNCDPAYPDVCLHDGTGDYDCASGSGNGPNYVHGPLRVLPPDPFGLDANHDGTGCEKG